MQAFNNGLSPVTVYALRRLAKSRARGWRASISICRLSMQIGAIRHVAVRGVERQSGDAYVAGGNGGDGLTNQRAHHQARSGFTAC